VLEGIEDGPRVHTPAGLDIGARTAPEIALSVAAEILSLRPRPAAPPIAGPSGPVSGRAIDPVCAMEVAVTEATARLEHAGRTWYFCAPGCVQAFADDLG
jgi:xanthine dehydrogenase accessory factor